MTRLFLTLFFLCAYSIIANAQRYQFKKYKTEEGLVSNETFAILQDKQNRIWVSTTSGISCFNGKTFKNYTTEEGLASNIVFSLFEDSKGRIWAGSLDSGLSIIHNGKISNPTGLEFNGLGAVTQILESKEGIIYIFFLKGIAIYKDGKLQPLLKDATEQKIAGIHSAAWYDDNTIYLTSTQQGIFKMTLDPLKIENVFNEESGINNICYSVFIDSAKNVWVGAYGELYKITNGGLTMFKFKQEDFDKNRIYDILEENENELFLSFEGNGFGIFNKQTGHLEIINKTRGLPSNYIYQTIKDTEGNHWMTSYGEGIIRFRDTAFKIYDQTQGLSSVNDIVEWNGELVVATNDGMAILDTTKTIRQITDTGPIKNLFVTPENKLLYNTGEAVYEHSLSSPTPRRIDEGDYNLIYQENDNTFLFGTQQIKVLAKDATYFIESRRAIAIAPIGDRFILCKISGLYQIDGNKIDTIPGLGPKIHNDFRSLDAINKNELLAATEKMLYYITLYNGLYKVKTFNMGCIASLNHFRALRVDGNNLWLAGRDRLAKVNLELLLKKDSIVVKNYSTAPYFFENDIDFNSLLVTTNKTIVASSLNGLLAFNEQAFLPNTNAPKLSLGEILLFAEPFNDSLYRTDEGIVLPYQKNYLSFSMEAITFTNPENVKYQYRMKGLREENFWVEPTTESNVVFSYLPPGDYIFEFTADNGDGVWQSQPYQYAFTIKLPFWKTWLFWVSLASFTTLAIFTIYYFHSRTERKRNEAYTHNLIKAQEEERTRVARELHDSVGQKLMLLTKKTKSTGNVEMEALACNTLDELRAISRGLHPATLERLGPTLAIRNMVNEVDTNSNIFFTHDIEDIDALLSQEASLHLYRIIQEVLNNMVKHADAKAASITIGKKKNTLEAIIADNGKGFDVAEKDKTGKSLGMKTLKERAKILHSKIDIKSHINGGTKVTLIIPL